MLKTEQILNAKFTPVSAGTYSAIEVDNFLKSVAESYEQNIQEKAALLKKMGILADKVEKYRNDEDAIKASLLDAHKMAESINKESRAKADKIIEDATAKAEETISNAQKISESTVEEAKNKAKNIVDNAKSAVDALKDKAQIQTDNAIKQAEIEANQIIKSANEQSAKIIGNSKDAYDFYTGELKKLKKEIEGFKTLIEALCEYQANNENIIEDNEELSAILKSETENKITEEITEENEESNVSDTDSSIPVESAPLDIDSVVSDANDDFEDNIRIIDDSSKESTSDFSGELDILADIDSLFPSAYVSQDITNSENESSFSFESEKSPIIEEGQNDAGGVEIDDDFLKSLANIDDLISDNSSDDDDDDISSLFGSLLD